MNPTNPFNPNTSPNIQPSPSPSLSPNPNPQPGELPPPTTPHPAPAPAEAAQTLLQPRATRPALKRSKSSFAGVAGGLRPSSPSEAGLSNAESSSEARRRGAPPPTEARIRAWREARQAGHGMAVRCATPPDSVHYSARLLKRTTKVPEGVDAKNHTVWVLA